MNAVLQAHREHVGRRIRMARVSSGLSHDQLAGKIGTSRQHLIKLEKGQHMPRPEMLTKIAEATGKDASYFESDDDDEESDAVADLMQSLRRVVRDEVEDEVRLALPRLQRNANEPSGSRQEALLGSSTNGG